MHGKVLILLAMAALGVWGSIAISSASAAAWCQEEAKAAECKSFYGKGTVLKASSASVEFSTSMAIVTCTSSELRMETLEGPTGAGKPLNATMTALTFGGCKTQGGTTCTTSESVNKPYTAATSWLNNNEGRLKLTAGGGEPGVMLKCGLFINCTFTAEPTLEFHGAAMPTLVVPSTALKGAGTTCPVQRTWEPTTYAVTTPTPLYISQS
jgi:hypothetical protein